MLKLLNEPQIYWRVIGLFFTAMVIFVLYAASNNATSMKAIAAFQSGEYHLGYHLLFDPIDQWSPTTKTAYAKMLLRGEYVSKDTKQGIFLLKDAANSCEKEALYQTGLLYFKGSEGFEKNLPVAYQLMLLSAQYGNNDAMAQVAWMYNNGIGTERDLPKGLFWLSISALRGNHSAWHQLEYLKVLFNPEEFNLVVNNLASWVPNATCSTEKMQSIFDTELSS